MIEQINQCYAHAVVLLEASRCNDYLNLTKQADNESVFIHSIVKYLILIKCKLLIQY